MASKILVLGLCALARFAIAHGDHHHEEENTQEPFIGWTKEDLDAKWGTDVSLTMMPLGRCPLMEFHSGDSVASRHSPILSTNGVCSSQKRNMTSLYLVVHSTQRCPTDLALDLAPERYA